MQDTGERHISNGNFNNKSELYLHLMHIATYEYVKSFVADKKVLDFGCGSGYGTKILSETAESVIGVDISPEAIHFAKREYPSSNLEFMMSEEIEDKKFDIITSFQVIEHVSNDSEYIINLKKLLNPKGILFISTPDKENRLFNHIQKPWNIFHLKEYSYNSLEALLKKHFRKVEVLKIGSDSDLIFEEIARTKKQRNITLPATLVFYPNFLRIFLLKLQKRLFLFIKKLKSGPENFKKDNSAIISDSKYSYKDILFEKELRHSTDLFVISRNDE